jgi:diguanylate cyclase (GGDEF)-like protein
VLFRSDFIVFGLLTWVYGFISNYIQLSIEKETLLTNANEILERQIAEQIDELAFLANRDTLTSLFNRRYFFDHLGESIKSLRRNETLALLLFDLDRFKVINDNYGHDVGDKILVNLAARLNEWNDRGTTIARLGGDEFIILLVGEYSYAEIADICEQIIELCGKPISVCDDTLDVTLSMGVSILTPSACDGKTLMKHADIAMYQAKSRGYNKYLFYNDLLSSEIDKATKIEVLLKQADTEKDFELYYQPQFSLPDLELIGAEALIQWKNTAHGYIPPKVFIPVAEEIDYIYKLGRWVMQESIRQAVKWNGMLPRQMIIGFNISPKQLNDCCFVPILKSMISEAGVNADWLDAEITESIMLNEDEMIKHIFTCLKNLGLSISIDDFGSGYSALGYLNKFPFDRIKLDKSLIDNVSPQNVNGTNIVRAVISMAKAVGIKTIAEGVETQEQLDILIDLGCDQAQGYLLGRPVPPAVFESNFFKSSS